MSCGCFTIVQVVCVDSLGELEDDSEEFGHYVQGVQRTVWEFNGILLFPSWLSHPGDDFVEHPLEDSIILRDILKMFPWLIYLIGVIINRNNL